MMSGQDCGYCGYDAEYYAAETKDGVEANLCYECLEWAVGEVLEYLPDGSQRVMDETELHDAIQSMIEWEEDEAQAELTESFGYSSLLHTQDEPTNVNESLTDEEWDLYSLLESQPKTVSSGFTYKGSYQPAAASTTHASNIISYLTLEKTVTPPSFAAVMHLIPTPHAMISEHGIEKTLIPADHNGGSTT